jgi:hypothetical protein
VITADYVRVDGHDLNFRPRVNQRLTGTTIRRLGALVPSLDPNTAGTRPTISRGKSQHDALILSARRRMSHGVDFGASHTRCRRAGARQRRRRAEHANIQIRTTRSTIRVSSART